MDPKWVRLVIFHFDRAPDLGLFHEGGTSNAQHRKNFPLYPEASSPRPSPGRQSARWLTALNRIRVEGAFSFSNGNVHDDGSGDVFAEAAALEAFQLIHGAVKLALQGAFVADNFFQRIAATEYGDGTAQGVFGLQWLFPHAHQVLEFGSLFVQIIQCCF